MAQAEESAWISPRPVLARPRDSPEHPEPLPQHWGEGLSSQSGQASRADSASRLGSSLNRAKRKETADKGKQHQSPHLS